MALPCNLSPHLTAAWQRFRNHVGTECPACPTAKHPSHFLSRQVSTIASNTRHFSTTTIRDAPTTTTDVTSEKLIRDIAKLERQLAEALRVSDIDRSWELAQTLKTTFPHHPPPNNLYTKLLELLRLEYSTSSTDNRKATGSKPTTVEGRRGMFAKRIENLCDDWLTFGVINDEMDQLPERSDEGASAVLPQDHRLASPQQIQPEHYHAIIDALAEIGQAPKAFRHVKRLQQQGYPYSTRVLAPILRGASLRRDVVTTQEIVRLMEQEEIHHTYRTLNAALATFAVTNRIYDIMPLYSRLRRSRIDVMPSVALKLAIVFARAHREADVQWLYTNLPKPAHRQAVSQHRQWILVMCDIHDKARASELYSSFISLERIPDATLVQALQSLGIDAQTKHRIPVNRDTNPTSDNDPFLFGLPRVSPDAATQTFQETVSRLARQHGTKQLLQISLDFYIAQGRTWPTLDGVTLFHILRLGDKRLTRSIYSQWTQERLGIPRQVVKTLLFSLARSELASEIRGAHNFLSTRFPNTYYAWGHPVLGPLVDTGCYNLVPVYYDHHLRSLHSVNAAPKEWAMVHVLRCAVITQDRSLYDRVIADTHRFSTTSTLHIYKWLFQGALVFDEPGRLAELQQAVRKFSSRDLNIIYNGLLNEYCRREQLEMAHKLLQTMLSHKVIPDSQNLNTVLIHAVKNLKYDLVQWVQNCMRRNGVIPNAHIRTMVLQKLWEYRQYKACVDLFHTYQRQHQSVLDGGDAYYVYSLLILHQEKRAEYWLRTLTKQTPSRGYRVLIFTLTQVRTSEHTWLVFLLDSLLDRLQWLSRLDSSIVYTALIRAYAMVHDPAGLFRICQRFLNTTIPISPCTASILFDVIRKFHRKLEPRVMQRIQTDGLLLNQENYSSLVELYANTGRPSQALDIITTVMPQHGFGLTEKLVKNVVRMFTHFGYNAERDKLREYLAGQQDRQLLAWFQQTTDIPDLVDAPGQQPENSLTTAESGL
ncbi:hypothetical protein IWQ62_003636 [Dispira parvispora]|uniref:Pentatricopeptide repeat-containing protein n=1 Tax=Dispira parvispora TaxID=1520584 RepID=A0A9W8ATD9_9FUNG|nr:hypothetical protein IWQ62_003636 [Dispira parvispora]